MNFDAVLGSVEQGLVYAILALGVYLSFRVLDFPDLTVDGSFPLGGAVAAKMIIAGYTPVAATIAAGIVGLAAGAVTGILNTKFKISGLLAGILTMTALYSINLRIMGRANIPLLRQRTFLTDLAGIGIDEKFAALIAFSGIVLVFKVLLDLFLHTEFGLALRATGDNEQMIRSLGVDIDKMKITGLALSNGLVAFSGGLVAQYQGFTDVGMGIGMIIAGLASVIVGEVIVRPTSVFRATLGVILGSIVYRLAVFFALRMGFAPTDLKLVTAGLVVIALAAPTLRAELSQRNAFQLLPGRGKPQGAVEDGGEVYARDKSSV